MKYYIIAGEASGDLHGSNLVRELKKADPGATIRCWGGDLMAQQGAVLVKHYRDLAFMGFAEVIKNLPTILKNLKFCKADITSFAPDVLVLIDYPGFNIRMAAWAKEQGLRVVYYISPQVWAWKESRVKTIRKVVDKMLVILPFEEAFYKKHDYKVVYVGHPLVQVVEDFLSHAKPRLKQHKPIVAILPGSRRQEITKKLPLMLEASRHFPAYQFIVARAPGLEESFYAQFLENYAGTATVANQTYQLLSESSAALVTSGTATLETALFGVPQVVCYKGSAISFAIARRLVKIKYISLVNLIMDKPLVKELIQDDLTVENLVVELKRILEDREAVPRMHQDYSSLHQLLRQGGNASETAAREILAVVQAEAVP
ncbi:MAG TPA: lipid-A-disaccharide synthase [Flavisolibacter sp.]